MINLLGSTQTSTMLNSTTQKWLEMFDNNTEKLEHCTKYNIMTLLIRDNQKNNVLTKAECRFILLGIIFFRTVWSVFCFVLFIPVFSSVLLHFIIIIL